MNPLKFILTICFLWVIVGLAEGNIVRSQWYVGGIPKSDYSCAGKVNGNYAHPTKCNSYIACVDQSKAYELSCGFSPEGKLLHFVQKSGPSVESSACAIPAEAGCVAAVDPTITTAAPTLPPPVRKECKVNECHQDGDCTSYSTCSNGVWEERQCGSGLFWNSDFTNSSGGTCDFYVNLNQTRQDSYLNDPNCIPPCMWWQDENEVCSGIYHYREPFNPLNPLSGPDRESTHMCSVGLVWNSATLSCDHKSNVLGC